jgi:hypothetical protein
VYQAVIDSGPSNSGTRAEAVRFHDDKTLYTGQSQRHVSWLLLYPLWTNGCLENIHGLLRISARGLSATYRGIAGLHAFHVAHPCAAWHMVLQSAVVFASR